MLSAALLPLMLAQWWSWKTSNEVSPFVADVVNKNWIASEVEWRSHRDTLLASLPYAPFDARRYWQLAELHRIRAGGLRLWPDRREEALDTASRYYRAVIRLAPHDGELLSRVAYGLELAGDPLSISVMRRAMDVAPYEPIVQYHVAEVGVRNWDRLDAETRRGLEMVVTHALRQEKISLAVRDVARRHNWMETLESLER
jgi:hypothetical protein